MSQKAILLRIPSRIEEIDGVEATVGKWLSSRGIGGKPHDNFLLAVREAVVNAVQYGGVETVAIELGGRNTQLIVRVKDDGEGFNPEALPDPLAPENLIRRSGRGILLMRAFADEVTFDFSSGTEVTLYKRISEPNAGEDRLEDWMD